MKHFPSAPNHCQHNPLQNTHTHTHTRLIRDCKISNILFKVCGRGNSKRHKTKEMVRHIWAIKERQERLIQPTASQNISLQLAQLGFSCHRSGLSGPVSIWLKTHHQTSSGIKDTVAITVRRRLHTETVQKSHFEEYEHLHDQIGQNVGKTLFMQKEFRLHIQSALNC